MESKIRDCFVGLFWGLVVCVAISLLFGCASTKYVEVPKVHTEYVYKSDTLIKQDSIHIKDSVYVQMKGDTLLIEKWKTAYRDRWRVEVKVDSVAVTDTLTKVVKVNELTHWQRTKISCFPWLMCFFLVCVGIFLFRVWKKFR